MDSWKHLAYVTEPPAADVARARAGIPFGVSPLGALGLAAGA
jgi:hypothetical protein